MNNSKRFLKIGTMLLSFSPLYFIACVVSLISLNTASSQQECVLGLISAVISFLVIALSLIMLWFLHSKTACRQAATGRLVKKIDEKSTESLSFFVTIIIPLISLSTVSTLQGFACFWLSTAMIMLLAYQMDICWQNPMLSLLGFRVYRTRYEIPGGEEKTTFVFIKNRLQVGDVITLTYLDKDLYLATTKRQD